jgi:UDP-N-acetylglucosamine transferase subunit ALG13
MIFVTVGTNEAPFDRLLRAVDGLPSGEELVVQCGASSLRPARAHCDEFLSFEELNDYIRTARLIVTHAGVGSIMVALGHGKRPVVVPRLHRFGEAVDDHQVSLAQRLETMGLVTLVEDLDNLLPRLINAPIEPAVSVGDEGRLAADLRSYLDAQIYGSLEVFGES